MKLNRLAFLLAVFLTEPLLCQDKQDLAVLYAGRPGGERVEQFDKFLQQHFTTVESIPGSELTTESASKFDVVICDWGQDFTEDPIKSQHVGYSLPDDFNKPVIMIGYAAGKIQKRSKIGWM
ncbi:MAG: hypothetical protein HQ519_02485 [Planctomycetes bacterium]|nr:hypothetical protein [Planctomycetota bacterium]